MKKFSIVLIVIGFLLSLTPWTLKWNKTSHHLKDIETVRVYYEEEEESAYKDLISALEAYNTQIYENHQEDLVDPFSYESTSMDLSSYGIKDDLVGSIWIPRMDVELPLYWGASLENMDKGAALLGQTSFPLEQNNTNAVIAAHRGHGIGNPMFRDIQLLQPEDEIYVLLPWTTCKYVVRESMPIEANDNNKIMIQEGKNMITLQSCHPYPESYARYIVYADFASQESSLDKELIRKEVKETIVKEDLDESEIASNRIIWWEDHLPYFGIALFTILTVFTIFNKRRSSL